MKDYKVLNRLLTVWHFLLYQVKAKHHKGRGIHSPFVFELVSRVLSDQHNFPEYKFFQEVMHSLKQTKERVEMQDLGSRSMAFNSRKRTVSQLLSHSSIDRKTGEVLFRLCRYYTPDHIIELGTSIGMSTLYMAKGSPDSGITTIEGNTSLAAFAQNLFRKYGMKGIDVRHGFFDEVLPFIREGGNIPRLVFIDGSHTYAATMEYFHFFCDWIDEGILLIHDIRWSHGMSKAWKEIRHHPKAIVTLDVFRMGIVILNQNITPGNFIVRF
jgi:predicted O-methyltransferase YrrM